METIAKTKSGREFKIKNVQTNVYICLDIDTDI